MTASTPTSVFPGLLSDNIGLYRTRPQNFLVSFLVHAMALAIVFWLATWITDRPNDPGPNVSHCHQRRSDLVSAAGAGRTWRRRHW